MLMCYEHHKVTNDVKKFTVPRLRKMKRDHERRFADPDRAILAQLKDWTLADEPNGVTNLGYPPSAPMRQNQRIEEGRISGSS